MSARPLPKTASASGSLSALTTVGLLRSLAAAGLASTASQGLTLVNFSAQPEPFLTQNAP